MSLLSSAFLLNHSSFKRSGGVGPKGDTGAQGPQGIQGPQGDKGDPGDPGTVQDFAVAVDWASQALFSGVAFMVEIANWTAPYDCFFTTVGSYTILFNQSVGYCNAVIKVNGVIRGVGAVYVPPAASGTTIVNITSIGELNSGDIISFWGYSELSQTVTINANTSGNNGVYSILYGAK